MRPLFFAPLLVLVACNHDAAQPSPDEDGGPRTGEAGSQGTGGQGAGGASNGGSPARSGAGGSATGGAGGETEADSGPVDAGDNFVCPDGDRREDIFTERFGGGPTLVGRCRKACLPIEITRRRAYEGCEPTTEPATTCTTHADCGNPDGAGLGTLCLAGVCVAACRAPDPAVNCGGLAEGGQACTWLVGNKPVNHPTPADCAAPTGGYWCTEFGPSSAVCGPVFP